MEPLLLDFKRSLKRRYSSELCEHPVDLGNPKSVVKLLNNSYDKH